MRNVLDRERAPVDRHVTQGWRGDAPVEALHHLLHGLLGSHVAHRASTHGGQAVEQEPVGRLTDPQPKDPGVAEVLVGELKDRGLVSDVAVGEQQHHRDPVARLRQREGCLDACTHVRPAHPTHLVHIAQPTQTVLCGVGQQGRAELARALGEPKHGEAVIGTPSCRSPRA